MKKYKLLRPLPGLPVGVIFTELIEGKSEMLCNDKYRNTGQPHFDLEAKYIDGWLKEEK